MVTDNLIIISQTYYNINAYKTRNFLKLFLDIWRGGVGEYLQ